MNRDVASDPKTGTIQNVNKDTGESDFGASYSILGDLKDGTGDMTDENVKIDGKYKFRLIPYQSGEPRLSADNTEGHIEWTQTSNPTTTLILQVQAPSVSILVCWYGFTKQAPIRGHNPSQAWV